MNRRGFLWAAGAAFLPPQARGEQCLAPAGCLPFKWGPGDGRCSKEGAAARRDSGVCLQPPYPIDFPPPPGAFRPFAPPVGEPAERPLWSSLLKENGHKLQAITDGLRRGYTEMLRRSSCNPNDPTGLLYQTWLHGYYCSGPKDIHMTWDFLPWHRAFLYFHERILAKCAGRPGLKIPVWDWEANAEIPPFFGKLGLPSFLTGHYQRSQPCSHDLGERLLSRCVMQAWLLSNKFEDFCGGETTNGDSGGSRAQQGPHTFVHMSLVQGAMANFAVAAADPVFYAHHANVDRFWTYWLGRYCPLGKPIHWLSRQYFFYDENAELVMVEPYQLLDNRVLGYRYPPDDSNWFTEFDSPSLLQVLQDVDELSKQLVSYLVGRFAALTAHPGKDLLEWSTLFNSSPKELLRNLTVRFGAEAMLPVRLKFKVPPDPKLQPQPGQYYLVQASRDGVANVGGFGFFAHHGGPARISAGEIEVAGCLDKTFFELLSGGGSQPLQFIYGVPEWDGTLGATIRGRGTVIATVQVTGLEVLVSNTDMQAAKAFAAGSLGDLQELLRRR